MKKPSAKTKYLTRHPWLRKILKICAAVLALLLILVALAWLLFGRSPLTSPEDIVWGITYSDLAAEELGLDKEQAYKAIVEDLHPSRMRLVAYWNRIEKSPGDYDFTELDRQVELAEANNIDYFIAVGQRVPRYPECHIPDWAKQTAQTDQQANILKFIERTIKRYDGNQHLFSWQIENEPFVGSFGDCPELDEDFLRQEFDLTRRLSDKKIIGTESGELSVWFKASQNPDVLGTTLYRVVLVAGTEFTVQHIFPPSYYRIRSNIAKWLNPNLDKVIVAELQAEPWASKPIIQEDPAQLERTMNPAQFENNIAFTESVGFPEVYFWGAEWWYYQKLQGNDYYWTRAQELFR